MKELRICLVVCVLSVCCEPLSSKVLQGVCGEHLTWSYDTETAHLAIEGYGELKNTVDSLWWNKDVLQASSWATSYNTYYVYNSAKTISLPEGLTKLPNGIFSGWWNLTACDIPEGVSELPNNAFKECYALKEITLPNSIERVGQYAFQKCTTMVKCDLGKGVKYIGTMAFEDCYALSSVRWSDCLETIDGSIFDGTGAPYSMQDVATIPLRDTLFFPATFKSSKSISWCYHNSPVIVWNAANPPASSSVFYNLYSYFNGDFIFGPDVTFVPANLCQQVRMKKVVLPEGCTYIGSGAFAGNNQLDTVILPSTLTAIHQEAFKGCSKIKQIILPEQVSAVNSSTFSGCTSLVRVHLPAGVSTIGDNAFSGCSSLDSIVLPKELTMIGGSAFSGVKLQDTLVIPDKVVSIGANAFANWSSLQQVTIGKGVVLMADKVFAGDSAITRIVCLAATPPTVSEGTLADIPDTAWLSVLPDSRKAYREHPYWGRFRMAEEPEDELVQKNVTVEAATTTAYFTWPTDEHADRYTLDIYKNGAVFCRLTLGPRGQLLGIAFSAPARNRNVSSDNVKRVNADGAYTLSFMVTGLDEASKYNYVLAAIDSDGKPIHVYTGQFATSGYPDEIEEGGTEITPTPPVVPFDPESSVPTAIWGVVPECADEKPVMEIHNGQLLIRYHDYLITPAGIRVE